MFCILVAAHQLPCLQICFSIYSKQWVKIFRLHPVAKLRWNQLSLISTALYLENFQESSVTRISLGVQSFQEEIRRKYNRKANRKEIQQKVDEIRKKGITNICADLIYNLEGQTNDSWMEDLSSLKKWDLPVAVFIRFYLFQMRRL